MKLHDIGLIGLAVMGQNLALNMERNGFHVAVYNRTESTTHQFLDRVGSKKNITGTFSLEELIASLKRPRKVMLMVKAGAAVDAVIDQLKALLDKGDIIIDGGNSHFKDTEQRFNMLEREGILYMGVGVSGGEEGALTGPSIMPGGRKEAWKQLKPVFEAISAKIDSEPCVTFIGPRGAGHFVKMVHNGIEYGDMQLIAEAYDLMRRGLELTANELNDVFSRWNQGELSSYLIEITSDIFMKIDPESNQPLVDLILDQAEQKGTGRWTSQTALDLGVPIPTINAAVEARALSACREERQKAADVFPQSPSQFPCDRDGFIRDIGDALYVAKICSYAQGMALLRGGSIEYGYDLNYSDIARIWRGGCIIRAEFLNDIRFAFKDNPNLPNLLLAPFFRDAVIGRTASFRRVVQTAVQTGIPVPAMAASLAYFDAYRSKRLPANLVQAQRDYFGAHTYKRVDRQGVFHSEWESQQSSTKAEGMGFKDPGGHGGKQGGQ
ncbi:MAG: NADP-dependent phosphogluconate dehydrogenase [Deltaproteobacteria bacterium]|nr:NADP-dependent phosphogluconate dehydrogenase [Deltaproteobacteria bacterium]MBW2152154.1 NADP-dependent phosphogluconate dehydrogenase [Deltaproteobacteria bacterium]